jgi:hypothetical protein
MNSAIVWVAAVSATKSCSHSSASRQPIGNGRPGTDADWQALMRDVETVGLELGAPGYFYPFWIWDLGLDNVRIGP